MNIGLDAHTLGSQVGGNETYIKGLIDGLKQIDQKNHYILYLIRHAPGDGAIRRLLRAVDWGALVGRGLWSAPAWKRCGGNPASNT